MWPNEASPLPPFKRKYFAYILIDRRIQVKKIPLAKLFHIAALGQYWDTIRVEKMDEDNLIWSFHRT